MTPESPTMELRISSRLDRQGAVEKVLQQKWIKKLPGWGGQTEEIWRDVPTVYDEGD